MISVNVTGINQEFNFQTRRQETFAVFSLPNGYAFRASITDETAQALIGLAIVTDGPPESMETAATMLPSPPRQPFIKGATPEGAEALVFGGSDASEEETMEAAEMEDVLRGSAPPSTMPAKLKFAGKDEFGYPILTSPGGVEPASVTGTFGEGDEDGVRQL